MGRAYSVRKASIEKTGAAKGKLYTIFSKEIYLAAKGNPNVESNINLKRIIERAKKAQVPNDIIERAIKKAKEPNVENYEVVIYEGFGPGSSTLIVKTMTDNVNRTISEIRTVFNKNGAKLSGINTVLYNYDHLALLTFKYDDENIVLESILDEKIDITDFEYEDGIITIASNINLYHQIKDILEKLIPNIEYEVDEIGYYAKDKVVLSDDDIKIFDRLIMQLENIEDVSEIFHNVSG